MSISSDDESEDSLEEPQLKYERVGSKLLEILKNDAASCIALHEKFIALGTHCGKVHILDHQGNVNTHTSLPHHSTTIMCISIDETGDFIACCSNDGMVTITGLYTKEYNQSITLDTPAKSIALEPGFAGNSAKQFVYGSDKLVLVERGWLKRMQHKILHQAEGFVTNIKWKGQFIAWANDKGVKIYDTKQQRRITFISRLQGDQSDEKFRPELYPTHIAWKDAFTLIVGWAKHIKVCAIREKPRVESREPSKFCVILHWFQTDFSCCGVAPLGDQVVALAYTEPIEEDTHLSHNTASALRPQLRILEPDPSSQVSYVEVSRDALSIRGYQKYYCNDYSLEFNSSELCVISPKDVVLAQQRDPDDKVTWLLQIHHYKEAMEYVKEYGKRLKKHTYLEVGLSYLSHLMDSDDYEEAALVCPRILGNNMPLWVQVVERFHKADRLTAIACVLPIGDFRLEQKYYELVLTDFLKKDHQGFAEILKRWPRGLYNIPSLTHKVKLYLNDSSMPLLQAALARLYEADNRYEKALVIYLDIKHPDVFQMIRKQNLYKELQENILRLMKFGTNEAVELLLDQLKFVPIDKVVSKLEDHPNYLHKYLHALFLRDPHLGGEFHALQVRLYAEFDRPRLLPFLRSSNYIALEEALRICEERNYVNEQVFLLSRMGNASRALELITEHEPDVSKAVEFCKEQNDDQLWDELINKSIHKPNLVRGLLENIGTHVDPIILIRRIPNGMEIPGLRDALVKILQDYSMQTALWWECKRILSSDVVSLMRKIIHVNKRPQHVDDERLCDSCGRPLLCKAGGARFEVPVIVCFLCQHAFHDNCIPTRDKCSSCRGNVRHSFMKT